MMRSNQKMIPENIVRNVLIGVMLGVVVIACLLLFIDFKKVMHAMLNMPVHFLLLAFLLTFCSYLLRLWKWHAFTKWSNFSLRLRDNAVIFFIGLMMSITPGKAGELIKSYFMHEKADVPYSESIPIVIYDRLTDMLAMLALVGIGLLVYPFGLSSLIVLVVLLIVGFVIIQRRTWMLTVIDWITAPKRLRRFRESVHHFYKQTLFLLQCRFLSFSFLVSVASWFLECVSLYLIVRAFSLDVSLLASILTFSLGTIAGALSMIPGGLGAAESSLAGLLIYFGVSGSLAVTISLIIRFVTLWFGVILGMIVFIFNRKTLTLRRSESD